MKVGVRPCYIAGKLPPKFRRIWSSFDAPTDNYSGSIAGHTSDVSGIRKLLPGFPSLSSLVHLHSPLHTARPNLTSLVSPRPPSCTRPKTAPNPNRAIVIDESGSSPIISKISSVYVLNSPSLFFPSVRFKNWMSQKFPSFHYI